LNSVPFLDLGAAYNELRDELEPALVTAARSAQYILGPEVIAFEAEFGSYVGAAHCVGVANGLEALAQTLQAAGIGPGDEVIVPAHTFIATWLAVTAVGATVSAVDAGPSGFLLDVDAVSSAVGPRTAAVIHVHLYGEVADLRSLRTVCDRFGLFLLEDSAQAHGAHRSASGSSAYGDAAAWSFYPAKNLGALGDAGAVTTADPALAERIRALRNYGSQRKYNHDVVGGNSRLDELQAAVLRVKLRHLSDWNGRRRSIALRYDRELREASVLLPTLPDDDSAHVWHLYVIRDSQRESLREELEKRGIGTHVHYPKPPHLQGAYSALGLAPGSLPTCERFAREVLSLPMGPHLSFTQQTTVIDAIGALRCQR
jgi:dTDP-4-amino-4,6-dideoxygalactose transaminase